MDTVRLMARQYGNEYGRSVEYVKVKTVFTSDSEINTVFIFTYSTLLPYSEKY